MFRRIAAVGLSLAAGAAVALLASSADAARGSDGAAVAANAFLKSLTPEMRSAARFPLDSPERLAWHYIPKDRVGVSLLKLDDTQSEFLGPLLATARSGDGRWYQVSLPNGTQGYVPRQSVVK